MISRIYPSFRVSHVFAILLWRATTVLTSAPAEAQVPHKLNYQGYLSSPSGVAFDGANIWVVNNGNATVTKF